VRRASKERKLRGNCPECHEWNVTKRLHLKDGRVIERCDFCAANYGLDNPDDFWRVEDLRGA
jgi:uncharacterized protein (DUF983 family)